jgi:hypothetical protein
VPLHRQVRAVQLEDVPARDDVLVLGPQRIGDGGDVVVVAGVVGVQHAGADDAGRGRGHERLAEAAARLGERRIEIVALRSQRLDRRVGHFGDRLRRAHQCHGLAVEVW